MGGSEYRNTANKIAQTPHHRKKYYQHTDTAKFTLSKCFFFKRQYHYFYFSNTRNTSQDIPIAFSVCKIPCCGLHFIINTWQLRWTKEVTAAKWYDSVALRSVLRPLKLEYIPTNNEERSLFPLISRLSSSSFFASSPFSISQKKVIQLVIVVTNTSRLSFVYRCGRRRFRLVVLHLTKNRVVRCHSLV